VVIWAPIKLYVQLAYISKLFQILLANQF
jgi:hypothetical protein